MATCVGPYQFHLSSELPQAVEIKIVPDLRGAKGAKEKCCDTAMLCNYVLTVQVHEKSRKASGQKKHSSKFRSGNNLKC